MLITFLKIRITSGFFMEDMSEYSMKSKSASHCLFPWSKVNFLKYRNYRRAVEIITLQLPKEEEEHKKKIDDG